MFHANYPVLVNLARAIRCNIGQVFQILRVVKTKLVPNWPRSNLKCFLLNHTKIFSSWFYTVFLLIMIMVIMVIWLDNE